MKKNILSLIIFTLSVGQIGCSSNPSSSTSPEVTNLQEIQKINVIGMSRSEFLTKFNPPVVSKLIGDKRIDTITYYKINNKSKAYGTALFNGLMEITVLSTVRSLMPSALPRDSLNEKVLISKSALDREKIVIVVTYDSSSHIEKIERVE